MPPAPFSSMRLPKVVICVSILVPWATILASRGYFGGPWKKQEGHEGVQNQIFIDIGSILRFLLLFVLAFEFKDLLGKSWR